MALSRRSFLVTGGLAASLLGGGGLFLGFSRWRRKHGAPAALFTPGAATIGVGALTAAQTATLDLFCRTLLPVPIEIERYREFLSWRALHLDGYRALYTRFVQALEQDGPRPFAERDAEAQKATIARPFAALSTISQARRTAVQRTPWDKHMAMAETEPGALALKFQRFIRAEVFAIYSVTEQLVSLGYDAPLGVPRGLTDYLSAPKRGN